MSSLSVECFCLQTPAKAQSLHGTTLCGVAQVLHIAIVLGVCGLERTSGHIFPVTCGTFYINFSTFIWHSL